MMMIMMMMVVTLAGPDAGEACGQLVARSLLVLRCTPRLLRGSQFEAGPRSIPADHSSLDCRVHCQWEHLDRCLDRSGAGNRRPRLCCTGCPLLSAVVLFSAAPTR